MPQWIKLVARNYAPLQISALIHQKHEGLQLGPVFWKGTVDLGIKYKSPLLTLFSHTVVEPCKTNMADFIQTQNNALDQALENAIADVRTDLIGAPTDSLEQLQHLYKRFRWDAAVMVAGYFLSMIVEQKIIESIGEEEWQKIKDTVLHPHTKTILIREFEAINNAHKNLESGLIKDADIAKVSASLAEEFGFIHAEYVAKEWTAEDYMREIQQKPIADAEENETINFSNVNPFVKWLFEVTAKCTYLFDEGKSALVRSNWAMRKSFKNFGWDEHDVLHCTESEFLAFIKSGKLPEQSILKAREDCFAIYAEDGRYEEYGGANDVESLIVREDIDEFKDIAEDVKELRGQVAFKGLARGRVRILFSQADANDFQDGEILVASMTTPELIGAMRKSAAFITDEGGIMCHAAIISRELKTPCIVGTNRATKVLKNGDMIEVNATDGIITIIN